MVRSVNNHREEEEEEDEEALVPSTIVGSSQRVQVEGRSADQKTNATRSKHSETEQRRRSKINERFQVLRDLIPQNDQKRDKASFLLEVIQYIQFLQEKIQIYEGSYQGWPHEPSKLVPWRNSCGPGESFMDQSQYVMNGSVQEDNVVVTPAMFTHGQDSVESDFGDDAVYKETDQPHSVSTQAVPLNMPLQPNVYEDVPIQAQASVSETGKLASVSRSEFGQLRACNTDRAAPSYTANEVADLKVESGESNISNAYSKSLLNTLTQALESSGVDMSQASISVQLDLGKPSISGLATMVSSGKDQGNPSPGSQSRAISGVGSGFEDSDQAHKRLRTAHS